MCPENIDTIKVKLLSVLPELENVFFFNAELLGPIIGSSKVGYPRTQYLTTVKKKNTDLHNVVPKFIFKCVWDLAECVDEDLAECVDENSPSCGWDLAEWLERLTANAEVSTVLGSILAPSDTVEYESRQMKQCWKSTLKKIPFF